MLKIDSNMTIKMSRGDDVKFPMFANQGTSVEPIRYTFRGESCDIVSYPYTIMKDITVDMAVWKQVVLEEGVYQFIYIDNNWTLDNEIIQIENYGIEYTLRTSTIPNQSVIVIDYHKGDGCEVYFKIFNLRQPNQCPIFVKTFTSDNDLWRGKHNQEKPNGDMKIELLHSDPLVDERFTLKDLPEGEYVYQVTGKLLDPLATQEEGSPQYVFETLTNRLRLYIIDDDYNNRLW